MFNAKVSRMMSTMRGYTVEYIFLLNKLGYVCGDINGLITQ